MDIFHFCTRPACCCFQWYLWMLMSMLNLSQRTEIYGIWNSPFFSFLVFLAHFIANYDNKSNRKRHLVVRPSNPRVLLLVLPFYQLLLPMLLLVNPHASQYLVWSVMVPPCRRVPRMVPTNLVNCTHRTPFMVKPVKTLCTKKVLIQITDNFGQYGKCLSMEVMANWPMIMAINLLKSKIII